MRQWITLLAVLVLPTSLYAGSQSLVTLGVGPSVGLLHLRGEDNSTSRMATDMRLRLRFLRGFAAEASWSPFGAQRNDDALLYDHNYRASGLLYVVPTYPVSGYLKVGFGGARMGDMAKLLGRSVSYHAGAGGELYIGEHFALGAEYLVLIPGADSLSKASGLSSGNYRGLPDNSLGFSNFRASLSLMYYL